MTPVPYFFILLALIFINHYVNAHKYSKNRYIFDDKKITIFSGPDSQEIPYNNIIFVKPLSDKYLENKFDVSSLKIGYEQYANLFNGSMCDGVERISKGGITEIIKFVSYLTNASKSGNTSRTLFIPFQSKYQSPISPLLDAMDAYMIIESYIKNESERFRKQTM